MKKPWLAKSETVHHRLEICRTCPHKKGMICGKCGCIIKAKTRLGREKCPIGKW